MSTAICGPPNKNNMLFKTNDNKSARDVALPSESLGFIPSTTWASKHHWNNPQYLRVDIK